MMKIKISNLSYSYPNDVVALKDISLEIMAGEQVVIVGQNGAGKTTLVKQLNGLLKPTVGVVNIGDWTTETSTIAKLSSRVGYVFQNPDEQLFCNTVRPYTDTTGRTLNHDGRSLFNITQLDKTIVSSKHLHQVGCAFFEVPAIRKWNYIF